jgi:hypothetical protein
MESGCHLRDAEDVRLLLTHPLYFYKCSIITTQMSPAVTLVPA